ncbi:MAG: DUF1848 family protein [Deltaproteobacteria bacterium]|nr:DUF1848 family protein [Deltaproteobacteria bacterium]
MKSSQQIVISASRRTDIPAFYMSWFMQQIKKRSFEVINPYNRKKAVVPAIPDKVHTIVFWSKNFGPFIEGGHGQTLAAMGYNLFFNFTVNSDDALLEPWVPPLKKRLGQLDILCQMFGAGSVTWRFDPICFYKTKQGDMRDNLSDFSLIAARAADCGIGRCITSFMDHYPKINKRTASIPGFTFVDPPLATKQNILLNINQTLTAQNIDLYTCCEKEILETLPADTGVRQSACIPSRLLVELYGGNLSFKRDAGQRIQNGCGCMISKDIGSYQQQPCYHNCLFCYANPAERNLEH